MILHLLYITWYWKSITERGNPIAGQSWPTLLFPTATLGEPQLLPRGTAGNGSIDPKFYCFHITARSNNRASDWERQQEGSAGKADIREAFLLRSVIAKSQLKQIWVKQRKKKGGFL